jgi:hypothetical protein
LRESGDTHRGSLILRRLGDKDFGVVREYEHGAAIGVGDLEEAIFTDRDSSIFFRVNLRVEVQSPNGIRGRLVPQVALSDDTLSVSVLPFAMACVYFCDRSILVVEDLTVISEFLNDDSLTSDHAHNFFLVLRDILLHHREFLSGNAVGDQRLLNVSVR